MLSIHLGHHFFGAGNIGDDLMLAGFLSTLGTNLTKVRITCSSPHNLSSQRKRFPFITWLEYSPMLRYETISKSDIWLGLGGSPFQSDGGDWFIKHLTEEMDICQKHSIPMYYLGVGVNNDDVFLNEEVKRLLGYAEHIWCRDSGSLEIIRKQQILQSGRLTLGSDFAHCYLENINFASKCNPSLFGLCLNLNEDPNSIKADLEFLLNSLSNYQLCWLIQEIRKLEFSELSIFSVIDPTIQQNITQFKPNYITSTTTADLLAAWPGCGHLISSRYHAAIIHAWAGSWIGILAINNKLRSVARELNLPVFHSLAELHSERSKELLQTVPQKLLHEKSELARSSLTEFLEKVSIKNSKRIGQIDTSPLNQMTSPKLPLRPSISTKNILFVCADSLGDLVLRQPLFQVLLDYGFNIFVAARTAQLELLPYLDPRLHPVCIDFDPYHPEEREEYINGVYKLIDSLSSLYFQVILCPQFNRTIVDEIILTAFSEKYSIGFAPGINSSSSLKKLLDKNILVEANHPSYAFSSTIPVDKNSHETSKYQELLNQAFNIKYENYTPKLTINAQAIDSAQAQLSKFNLVAGSYAISCPIGGTNVTIKSIPDSISIDVASNFALKNIPILFVGVEQERARLEKLYLECIKSGASAHLWIGGSNELGCLLGLIAQAKLYFGADTGPMHIAAALNVPVYAVMGGGTYPRFLPVAEKSLIALNKLDCFGCDWACIYDEPRCIQSLNTAKIITELNKFIATVH